MTETKSIDISIPNDEEGYILLQCEHCGEYFKIKAEDALDDRWLSIYCPCCGLVSENYVTADVIKLAQAKVHNYATDMVFNVFKELERKTKTGAVRFKAGKKPKLKDEQPIKTGIEALSSMTFDCCNRSAKLKPLLQMTGCYCPFCGVKYYETK